MSRLPMQLLDPCRFSMILSDLLSPLSARESLLSVYYVPAADARARRRSGMRAAEGWHSAFSKFQTRRCLWPQEVMPAGGRLPASKKPDEPRK